jgi:hypothetical protein
MKIPSFAWLNHAGQRQLSRSESHVGWYGPLFIGFGVA